MLMRSAPSLIQKGRTQEVPDRRQSDERLKQRIEELETLPRDKLAERWERTFKCKPPKGVKSRFLQRALAYELQARALGALKPSVKRQLSDANIGRDLDNGSDRKKTTIRPGTRLVRDWNGRSYTVDVTPEGFHHNGKTYRSLSAIASEITGVRWSGPRFFGL